MSDPITADLDALIERLDEAATALRAGQAGGDEAAELVDRCAELATRIGAELDRRAREAEAGSPPGQEQLL